MRQKMISYIERVSGCIGDWDGWSDMEIKKLYIILVTGAPIYYEDTELI